ncbi:hypothetical protein Ancab_028962 [Ancistrocladus abbreviatus]
MNLITKRFSKERVSERRALVVNEDLHMGNEVFHLHNTAIELSHEPLLDLAFLDGIKVSLDHDSSLFVGGAGWGKVGGGEGDGWKVRWGRKVGWRKWWVEGRVAIGGGVGEVEGQRSRGSDGGEVREHLVSEIIGNAVAVSEDCYGNYVVQHVLGLRIPQLTERLLKCLEGSYVTLSCNRYGSRVVEKCITESNPKQSAWVVGELLKSPHVSMLLLDPFGNFVIPKALSYSKGFFHNALLNLVRMHTPSMCSNLYGKKVLASFDQNKLKLV